MEPLSRSEDGLDGQAVSENVPSGATQSPQPAGARPRRAFLVLLPVYAIVDFLGPWLFAGEGRATWVLLALWWGAVAGQVVFLVVWAVLGPFRRGGRGGLALLATVALYFCFVLGLVVISWYGPFSPNLPELVSAALFIPLLFLVAQLPLWIRRLISGWRIVATDEVARRGAIASRQFGLIHILGLMLVLGAALSLVQVAMVVDGPPRTRTAEARADVWAGMATTCGFLLLYCAVCAGPSLRACLLARNRVKGCLAMVGVWLAVSALAVFLMTVGVVAVGGNRMTLETVASIFLHFAAATIVLAGSLHLLRACGCVMIRAKDVSTPNTTTAAAGPAVDDASPPAAGPAQPGSLCKNGSRRQNGGS